MSHQPRFCIWDGDQVLMVIHLIVLLEVKRCAKEFLPEGSCCKRGSAQLSFSKWYPGFRVHNVQQRVQWTRISSVSICLLIFCSFCPSSNIHERKGNIFRTPFSASTGLWSIVAPLLCVTCKFNLWDRAFLKVSHKTSSATPSAYCVGRACQGGGAVWALHSGCWRPQRSGCETEVWRN